MRKRGCQGDLRRQKLWCRYSVTAGTLQPRGHCTISCQYYKLKLHAWGLESIESRIHKQPWEMYASTRRSSALTEHGIKPSVFNVPPTIRLSSELWHYARAVHLGCHQPALSIRKAEMQHYKYIPWEFLALHPMIIFWLPQTHDTISTKFSSCNNLWFLFWMGAIWYIF